MSAASSPARGGVASALLLATSAASLWLSGCVPPQGGWDVDALERATPALAALAGQRLGDLIPFPAPDPEGRDDRLVLVACRYATGATVRVRGGGPDWPAAWAVAAVVAVDRRLPSIDVVVADADDGAGDRSPEIAVEWLAEAEGAGPQGFGDTLSVCDVSPRAADGAPRGALLGAEIRMRGARPERIDRVRSARADEWVGAFLHELGHALGFSGHVAVGDSILVREAMRLRRLGRRALDGEVDADPTLAALYALPPGARLGHHPLDAPSADVLAEVRAAVRERAARGRAPVAVVSVAGDHAARIAWRYADGSEIGVRMSDYAQALRRGEAIELAREAAAPGTGSGS